MRPRPVLSWKVLPLVAAFGGCKTVYPLVGLGAGELAKRFAYAAFEAGHAILAPELLGESPEKVDLALARLVTPGSPPAPPRASLRRLLRNPFNGLGLRVGPAVRSRVGGPGSTGALEATRGRIAGGRSLLTVGELFESGSANVHGIPQGAGLSPRFGHTNDVRHDVPAHVIGRGIAEAGEGPVVLHLRRSLDHGHVAVLGSGNLNELRIYAAQAPAVGLVEQTGE